MKTILALTAAGVILAGCVSEPVVDRAQAVPAAEILSILDGRPFECGDYRAATDSCAYLATYRGRGANIRATAQFALQENPPLTAEFTLRMQDTGSALCANTDTLSVNVPRADAELGAVLTKAVGSMFGGVDRLCSQYFRSGPDVYIVISTDAAGNELPDSRTRVRFFAEPKALFVDDM